MKTEYDITVLVNQIRGMHAELMDLRADYDRLRAAAEVILWKLDHNFSKSGEGGDCVPGTIDRRDATVKTLRAALRKERD